LKAAETKIFVLRCTGFCASAVMLTLIQPPFGFSFLAWFSLIPFILACSPKARPKQLFVAAYLVSLLYWLGNLYWLIPVTWPGWLAFCLYTALLWPMLALCVRYCRIKKLPLLIAVPVLVVGAERLQGLFLGGFYWRFLAHSQYANITLIQTADIFGAAGLSFLIAMVNGLLAELIIAAGRRSVLKIHNLFKAAFVCAVVIATVLYGKWRISQSPEFIEDGPLVGSVQTNVPQFVKESMTAGEEILDGMMADSAEAVKAGAELVIWPETMVQATINNEFLRFLEPTSPARLFDSALCRHAAGNAYLLIGSHAATAGVENGVPVVKERYNSAFLYRPDGRQAPERYDKIHLVPFGEVVPFRKTFPLLYRLLMKFTPYDYEYSLDYGRQYTVFEIAGGQRQQRNYKFAVLICYEDTVPAIAGKFALDESGNKRLDWLINISNDGWFVRFKDGKVLPSTELAQHTANCVFRAVENRLAVVRSVNTGISCFIDTLGRVKNGFQAGSLPQKAFERTGVAGWLLDTVPIDKRLTFFSRYGQWLDYCCAVCFVGLLILQLWQLLFRNKKYREKL